MSYFPDDLRYSKTHEWIKKVDDYYLIGITDFAQDQLGDIVYVDFPEVGSVIDANEPLGELESSKAVSEINMPVTGKVIEINEMLDESPESINSDPYGSWIVKIEASDNSDYESLLDSKEAEKLYGEES